MSEPKPIPCKYEKPQTWSYRSHSVPDHGPATKPEKGNGLNAESAGETPQRNFRSVSMISPSPRLPPPPTPFFCQQKSASHGDISADPLKLPASDDVSLPPISGDVPPPLPPILPPPRLPTPPEELKKLKKQMYDSKRRNRFRGTLRRSAHLGMRSIRRRFRPQDVLYIIYNITQKEALQYNGERGFKLTEINWEFIRKLVGWWKADEDIWAIGTDGTEYNCVQTKGVNPTFGMSQPKEMPRGIREEYHTGDYTYYYYEKLLSTPTKVTTNEGWILLKHRITGQIMDVH